MDMFALMFDVQHLSTYTLIHTYIHTEYFFVEEMSFSVAR